MKKEYSIEGVTCMGCVKSIKEKLKETYPEISVNIASDLKKITLKGDQIPNIEELQRQLPSKYFLKKQKDRVLENIKPSTSKILKLKPLFIIFGYVITISVLINVKQWSIENFMLDFMGVFFMVFSFFKILDIKGFAHSFKMYDPLAKLVPFYATIYPFIEVILGFSFLYRFKILAALIITLIILSITTIGVTKTLLKKNTIECACLGSLLKLPMTEATFIENTIMIIMGLIMLLKFI